MNQPSASTLPAEGFFEWGALESPMDALLPAVVFIAALAFVIFMYRKDAAELPGKWATFLIGVRLLAFGLLFVIFLRPQWRTESSVVRNSRVLVLVDTSLSMSLRDERPTNDSVAWSRIEQVRQLFSQEPFLADLQKTHDLHVFGFDERLTTLAVLPKEGTPQTAPAAGPGSSAQANQGAAEPSANNPNWQSLLATNGAQTNLAQAVSQILSNTRGEPIAGVVFFTDGADNGELDADSIIQAVKDARVPIHTVGLGALDPPANVRVAEISAPRQVTPGDSVTITAYLQSHGLGGKSVSVSLLTRASDQAGSQLVQKEPSVTLPKDGEPLAVTFSVQPKTAGKLTYAVEVQSPLEDQIPADNTGSVEIDVVDREMRVLLFAGAPGRDYRFLQALLYRESDLALDVLLQTGQPNMSQDADRILFEFPASSEDLFAYDCIIALDPDWTQLTEDQAELLTRWVSSHGGGLIVAAGNVHTSHWTESNEPAIEKIRSLYPVEFPRRLTSNRRSMDSTSPHAWNFTRAGQESSFLWLEDSSAQSLATWGKAVGLFGHYRVKGPKPAATVYAYFGNATESLERDTAIHLAGQFFGSGRVLFMASSEIWRLRSLGEQYPDRLYLQFIRYAAQGRLVRGTTHGTLLLERDRFALGDNVMLRAQLLDGQLHPLVTSGVFAELATPTGGITSLKFKPDSGTPGTYICQYVPGQEGSYQIELSIPGFADERLTRRFSVVIPDRERLQLERNAALLQRLSLATGGTYVERIEWCTKPAGAAPNAEPKTIDWETLLPDRTQTSTVLGRPISLWDNVPVLLLVCGLFCLEWLTRRLLALA